MRELVKISLLLLCTPFIATSGTIDYVKGSALLVSKIVGKDFCGSSPAQVFIVRDKTVNYQIPVPMSGDFSVHLMPGDYQVIAINQKGCFSDASLRVKENQYVEKTYELKKVETTSFFQRLLNIVPKAEAMSMCLDCLNQSQGLSQPRMGPSFGGYPSQRWGYPTPYWGPFGHWSFNRFNSPCPMGPLMPGAYSIAELEKNKDGRYPAGMGFAAMPALPNQRGIGGFSAGCQSPLYPGGGGMVAGKPVVYLHGTPGEKIKFKINLSEESNFLATAPVLPVEGVELEIGRDGKIHKDEVEYPYFFYDVRTDLVKSQQVAGKCVGSEDLIKTMVDYLARSGFNKNEQEDFSNYWNVKLPKLDEVCIYPQVNQQLNSMSQFKIESKKPVHETRILFVLVPVIDGRMPASTFTAKPEKEWSPNFKKAGFSSNKLILREWGVAFLTVPERTGKMQPLFFNKSPRL